MCPFRSCCSMICPIDFCQKRHESCARYEVAKELGIEAVPDDMSTINYTLIEKLKKERSCNASAAR